MTFHNGAAWTMFLVTFLPQLLHCWYVYESCGCICIKQQGLD